LQEKTAHFKEDGLVLDQSTVLSAAIKSAFARVHDITGSTAESSHSAKFLPRALSGENQYPVYSMSIIVSVSGDENFVQLLEPSSCQLCEYLQDNGHLQLALMSRMQVRI